MSAESSPVRVEIVNDTAVVEFVAPSIVDPIMIQRLGEELYALVEEAGHKKIVIDFGGVRFLSSQTLGLLLTLRKKADAIGSQVHISGMKPDLHKVFRITKLDSLFDFHSTSEEAIAAMDD